MDILAFAFPAAVAGFAVGIVFHKYVISEADSIKQHVSDEMAEVRADFASLLDKVKAKL